MVKRVVPFANAEIIKARLVNDLEPGTHRVALRGCVICLIGREDKVVNMKEERRYQFSVREL